MYWKIDRAIGNIVEILFQFTLAVQLVLNLLNYLVSLSHFFSLAQK